MDYNDTHAGEFSYHNITRKIVAVIVVTVLVTEIVNYVFFGILAYVELVVSVCFYFMSSFTSF